MVLKIDSCLMQVKSMAECSNEHSAILSTCIKLPPVFKAFGLSIFEWPLQTGVILVLSCHGETSQTEEKLIEQKKEESCIYKKFSRSFSFMLEEFS